MIADILEQAKQSGKISQAEREEQSRRHRKRRPLNDHDRIAQAIEDRMVHGNREYLESTLPKAAD